VTSRRRLGLAGTDPDRRLVTALRTMPRRRLADDLAALGTVVRERAAVGLVLGLPLNMDGSAGPMAQAARSFARELDRALGLPVLLQDERLTTFAVDDAIAAGRLPRPRKGEATDHYAAAVILEDALRSLPQQPPLAS
jgi:putative Holliday junction resolvase